MNKYYTTELWMKGYSKPLMAHFDDYDVRKNLNDAMSFAEKNLDKCNEIRVLCNGNELVWSSISA